MMIRETYAELFELFSPAASMKLTFNNNLMKFKNLLKTIIVIVCPILFSIDDAFAGEIIVPWRAKKEIVKQEIVLRSGLEKEQQKQSIQFHL